MRKSRTSGSVEGLASQEASLLDPFVEEQQKAGRDSCCKENPKLL